MVGSWFFLVVQSLFLVAWIVVNVIGYLAHLLSLLYLHLRMCVGCVRKHSTLAY